MDYSALFSKMGEIGARQGAIGAPSGAPVDAISFAGGLPDPGSFPLQDLRAATERVLAAQSGTALQYGPPQGTPKLRQVVADRLNEAEGLSLDPDQIGITSGSLQGITLLAQLLVDPGDTVLIEAPTFLGTVRMFNLFRPRYEELPLDEHGLVVEELERKLVELREAGVHPKFLYCLPTFQNPTGVTMPLDRRIELLRVAREHSLLVIEDDPYGELRYDGAEVPSLLSLDRDGLVIRLGTFSKILAAGLRLGWAAGPKELVQGMASVKLDSGTNPYAAHLAAEWAAAGKVDGHVAQLRAIYKARRDAMLGALEEHCAGLCTWTRPDGGFFIWVHLEPEVDPARLRELAHENGVLYLPGTACFASTRGEDYLRLAFSLQEPERIRAGIARLGAAMRASVRVA